MSEIQTIVIVILQVVFSLPAAFSLLLLFGVGGGMIAGFHEKPSDERAIEIAVPGADRRLCLLFCLATRFGGRTAHGRRGGGSRRPRYYLQQVEKDLFAHKDVERRILAGK